MALAFRSGGSWAIQTDGTTKAVPAERSGLSLIQGTREYLHAFATGIETGNAEHARQAILSRFPDHRVQQFLDVFSLPAYFPPPAAD